MPGTVSTQICLHLKVQFDMDLHYLLLYYYILYTPSDSGMELIQFKIQIIRSKSVLIWTIVYWVY